MGDVAVAKGNDILVAPGIGSCVIIAIYHPKDKIGGMAHAVLAGARERSPSPSDTSHVNTAIDELLKRMARLGADRRGSQAKLVGGANMFSAFESSVGADNVSCARDKLKKEGVTIAGECVGGSQGRSVEFSVATGIITVKTKF